MKNTLKIIIGVVIIIIISAFIHYKKANHVPNEQVPVATDSIIGCYVATLQKDVYTLKIASQKNETFEGTLSFKNFEKDSSSGTYTGIYKDGILLGSYSFQSEGMNSMMQVIFKKSGNDFIRGYGEMNSDGTTFKNINTISYDSSAVFKGSQESCL